MSDSSSVDLRESACTLNPGDFLVIWITGMVGYTYIAQVVQSSPLVLKVKDSGPLAKLRDGDFMILQSQSAQLQEDVKNHSCVFLKESVSNHRKVVSGLRSLGVDFGLREILPP
ncbi:MAG: hypothetical protein ACOZBH_02100 [Patescibacteria group bacterium]